MPPGLSDNLLAARQRVASLSRQRDVTRQDASAALADIQQLQATLSARQAVDDRDGAAAARAGLDDAVARRRGLLQGVDDLSRSVAGLIDAIGLDDLRAESDVPIALLPVRIETRSTAGRAQLRVRIYPDDIHVDQHDRGLSDEERAAGIDYWTAVWAAENRDAVEALVAKVGTRRAAWVATALTPDNLAARPDAAPRFPATGPRGNRPPVVRTLPDRFHVFADQGGVISEAVGETIRDELVVGLAGGPEFAPIKDDGDLPAVDQAMRWMVDYTAAVAAGMAITLDLRRPGQRIDRLIVLGLRSTLAPDAAARALEQLLVAHRFSDGAAFVAQGTPTNNTESDRTAWALLDAVAPPRSTAPAVDADSNAGVMARMLGITASSLADWPHASDAEQPRARAMNTALWAPTWEAMLRRILSSASQSALLGDGECDDLRRHFIESVRARGPIPALRLGKQPYGVLPVVATDAASFRAAGGTVETRLVPFLRAMRAIWDQGAQSVPRVATGDIDQTLPDILGTSPVMQGLRVRSVVERNLSYERQFLAIADGDNERAQDDVASIAWRLVAVEPTAVNDSGLLGKETRALALPLAHASDPAFIQALLDGPDRAPTPQSVLQALLGLAAATELARRERLATTGDLDRLHAVASDQVGNDVDQALLHAAFAEVTQRARDPQAASKAAAIIEQRAGRFDTQQLAARQVLPGLSTTSAFAALTGNGQQLTALNPGRAGLQLLGAVFAEARREAEFRAALDVLRGVTSLDERALLLGETLDLASHRLDAWLTAIATNRLDGMREQRAGIMLGAYGWVEDIELIEPRPTQVEGLQGPVFANPVDGGYIHAPSLTHAATAAILRSGRLTHRPGDASDGALNIDLSSGRVREALALIDGVRQGQTLGALLGYRLERTLHERSGGGVELDRFIYVLRGLAPLVAGKLTDPGAAQESTAASNVVDGVALLELQERHPEAIDAALDAGPKDKSHIGNNWKKPTPAELVEVHRAIAELDRTHDAVADVTLAEAVHQLVKGNAARAAAALDSIGGGEAIPPEPDVVRTPRSGTSLTHRIAVVISEPALALAGWNRNAPRAQAEPRLESWAQAQFGPAGEIALVVDDQGRITHTLAEVGMCALDLLWEADGDDVASTSLGWRLRRRIPGLRADLSELTPFGTAWELARSLRRLVAHARPVLPVRQDREGVVTWSVPPLFERKLPGTFEPAALPSLLDRISAAQRALESAAQTFDESDDAAVRATIDALVPFGLRVPPRADVLPLPQLAPLASSLVAEARRRAAQAKTSIAAAGGEHPELLVGVFAEIFGDGFLAVPLIAAPPAGDAFAAALGPGGVRALDGLEIRPWLARAAAVRAAVGRYAETVLYREALHGRIRLRIAQTPVPSVPRWVGLPFPPDSVLPRQPMTGLVLESMPGSALTGAEAVAAFIVDEWTDVVPRRLVVGDPEGPPEQRSIQTIATTGVAVNANGPNARPPQTILLAISPDGTPWSKDSLLHVLRDTLDLLRERTVTLERVPWAGRILPAVYCQDWSLQGEPVLNYKSLATEYKQSAVLTFVKD